MAHRSIFDAGVVPVFSSVCCTIYFVCYCLSSAIHCMGQNIKSLVACVLVCVCARTHTGFGAKYRENG